MGVKKIELFKIECDKCGASIEQVFESVEAALKFATTFADWRINGDKIYCMDCYIKQKNKKNG